MLRMRNVFLIEGVIRKDDDLEIRSGRPSDDIHTSGATCHPVELEEGKSNGHDEDSDFCDKPHFPPTLNLHPHHFYIRNFAHKVALLIRAIHKIGT